MGSNTGYGVFRILKGRVDLGHSGKDGRIFMYMLYDKNEVRLFHYHYAKKSDPNFASFNIKDSWRNYSSLIDSSGSGESLFDVDMMISDLREVFKEIGVYDLKEDNISKLKEIDNMLVKRAAQFYNGEVISFTKIDLMTVLEAEELLSKFPEEKPKTSDVEESSEEEALDSEEQGASDNTVPFDKPKITVNCSILMDPLKGIPVSSIKEGDIVTFAVPEDSFAYKSLKKQDSNFDGKIERTVLSVTENESERIVMEFSIFEGVGGAVIAQKNLKIKGSHSDFGIGGGPFAHLLTPTNIMFLAGASFLLIFYLLLQYLD